jgi:hypothetical protein
MAATVQPMLVVAAAASVGAPIVHFGRTATEAAAAMARQRSAKQFRSALPLASAVDARP